MKLLLVALTLCAVLNPHAQAQTKSAEAAKSALCTRDIALDMVKQQVNLTKTFSNNLRRITVLLRAADLLWPYEQSQARAIFTDAFELATQYEKEDEQNAPRSMVQQMETPDQRYVVIGAVAKRDPQWANELTARMLKPDTRDASATSDSSDDFLTSERLFYAATLLASTYPDAAWGLALTGLKYPLGTMLSRYLYRVAETNQHAADVFYAQALSAYGRRPLREFLYLAAYPFGSSESFDTPIYASYEVPPKFEINKSLQRRFVQILLTRAEQALEAPPDPADQYRAPSGAWLPGKAHLMQSLLRIEPQVRTSLPDLSVAFTQARDKLLVSLSPETQKLLVQLGREAFIAPNQTFAEQIEAAEKVSEADRRDDLIATAVLSDASDAESLANVVEAIDKISDSEVRIPLFEVIHFRRAAAAVKEKKFDEAERLAAQVAEDEQRAFLHAEIAKGLLNRKETQLHARELLEQAITEAKKAGNTIFAARTLLTISNLCTKVDLNRAIEILTDAINCINHIDSPDFFADDQTLVKIVQRGGGSGQYVLRFPMPGLDPERMFREMAQINFDTALAQSSGLTDKLQRALSTLAVAEVCLQQAPQRPKEPPKKSAKP
jgi:hypothetical protein